MQRSFPELQTKTLLWIIIACAIIQSKYGSFDVLEYGEVEKPSLGDDEVLVKVHAAADLTVRNSPVISGSSELNENPILT